VTHLQIGELVSDQVARGCARGRVAEADLDGLAVAADAAMADVLVAQCRADVAGRTPPSWSSAACMSTCSMKCTPPRKSSPRYMGWRVQRGQPGGRARHQVQRDDVGRVGRIGYQRLLDRVLGLELVVGRIEARRTELPSRLT
jgi:hypothetical protein